MEALTTTATGAVTPPLLSLNKFRNSSVRRIIRFSTSPKNDSNSNSELNHESDSSDSALVPIFSKDAAMGLVLSAANVRGWTTGSGMEGPPTLAGSDPGSCLDPVSTFPWSLFTKSPRRRMRVAFTCKVCGQRTTRAINPHAYTDGTVFVQCCGCNIFHKLVDNLNLFNEMKCYVSSNFNPNHLNDNMNFKFLDEEGNSDDTFPLL